MSNVIPIAGMAHSPTALRNIADGIERGDFDGSSVTVIAGPDVFHAGCINDAQAAQEAIWNMTCGIHKLMYRPLSLGESK